MEYCSFNYANCAFFSKKLDNCNWQEFNAFISSYKTVSVVDIKTLPGQTFSQSQLITDLTEFHNWT